LSLPPGATLVSGQVPMALPPGATLVSGGSVDPQDAIKKKYGLPPDVDLSKSYQAQPDSVKQLDPMAFSHAYQEFNPPPPEAKGFLANLWGEAKNIFKGTANSEPSGTASGVGVDWAQRVAENPVNAVPVVGPMIAARANQAKTDVPGAIGAGVTDLATMAAPLLIDKALDFSPTARIEEAMGRRLSAEEASAVRSPSASQPALNVTNQDVLTHASQNGVKLTPGQALEDPAATNIQKMGTTAMVGGKDLSLALRQQRHAFVDSVNKLGKAVDPQGVGINDETAGHTIQKNVQDTLNALQGKASATYSQVAQQQQNLSGDIRGLSDFANSKRTETITDPRTGETSTRPIYQGPSVKAALDDVASKPDQLGPNPSIASLRSLRSEFWEKGNDYSGNIPDSARAIYKQAASQVDDAIVKASQGTPFEGTFRDANAQWKSLQSKYNEPGQPLYKILQQDDPTKITAQLQNAPAQDIAMLRQELRDGPAIQALRRSVVNDIANNKFTIRNDGLGGYSHEYLNALFGPGTTKQLYLKADLARRIGYDANPSGTGSAISVLEQGTVNPATALLRQGKLTTFAKLSMPRDPLSFLPGAGNPSLPGRGRIASLSNLLALSAGTPQQPSNQ
jgi:hypothetical protein